MGGIGRGGIFGFFLSLTLEFVAILKCEFDKLKVHQNFSHLSFLWDRKWDRNDPNAALALDLKLICFHSVYLLP